MEGRLVGGLGDVYDGCRNGVRPVSGVLEVGVVASDTVCDGVGGWAGGVGGGCPPSRNASTATACARVMRDGRAGHASSPFQMGDGAGVTGDVAPLHGALAAQDSVFPMTAAQRVHRRLFRLSRTSAKTAVWAEVEEARTGRDVRWKRLTCVRQEPHVVNAMGLCPLLRHEENVQEKRGVGAVVGGL